MPEPNEQKNLTAIIGLLATAIGAFALSLFLGEKKKPLPRLGNRERQYEEDLPLEEQEPEYYGAFYRPGPPQYGRFFRDVTAAEETPKEELFVQQFGMDPERIAKYTPVHERPEITESDIYDVARCTGLHYNLRFLPNNWCRELKDKPMSAEFRENIIRYLESKGYKKA